MTSNTAPSDATLDIPLRQSLARMSRINLLELERAQLHDRVESKVILRQTEVAERIEALRHDYSVFELDGRRSQSYRTEYFDSALLRDYHDHHNQKRHRAKVRYRTYLDSDVTFFELKQNVGGRTVKVRRRSQPPVNNRITAEDGLFLYQTMKRDPGELFPSLSVDYRRVLLVKNDFSERVTIDLDVQFRSEGRNVQLLDLAICEFKQESFDRSSPAILAMKSRPQMFSKYCMGLASCNPVLRRNRFKKVFRQLDALGITKRQMELV